MHLYSRALFLFSIDQRAGRVHGRQMLASSRMCLPHPVTMMLVAKTRRTAAVISTDGLQDACSEVNLVAFVPRSGRMHRNLGFPLHR